MKEEDKNRDKKKLFKSYTFRVYLREKLMPTHTKSDRSGN